MATKINTKFVAGLVAGATLVCVGIVYASYTLVQNTPERLISMGDKQLEDARKKRAAGEAEGAEKAVKQAITFYSKAVNKQQTNVEFLKKWDAALAEYAPAQRVVYQTTFSSDYMMIRRQTAILLQTDVQAHRAFLDLIYKQTNNASSDPEFMVTKCEDALRFFASGPDDVRAKADGLKRYRGLAILRLAQRAKETTDERIHAGREDLVAALRYDPKDELAAEGLYSLYQLEAARATDKSRNDEAKALRAEADKVIDGFLAQNPRNPRIMLDRLIAATDMERIELNKLPTKEQRDAEQEKARQRLTPQLDAAHEAVMAADPKSIDSILLQVLTTLELQIDPPSQLRRSNAAAQRMLEARPNEPEILLYGADLASKTRQFDKAIEMAGKVVELPVPPISWQGLLLFEMKRSASEMRAGWAMDLAEFPSKDADREKLLARAKTLRDSYADLVESTEPRLKFLNGRISMAEGRAPEAGRLFKEYNDTVNDADPRGLLYAAMATMSQANPNTGFARERLNKLLALQPGYVPALVLLTQVEITDQNIPGARRALQAASEADPSNEQVRKMAESLSETNLAERDPAAAKLLEISGKISKPELEAEVLAGLRQLQKDYPDDVRVDTLLATVLNSRGDRAGALKAVEESLAKHPQDKRLQEMRVVLSTPDDPMKVELDLAQQSDAPELEKLLRTHFVYKKYGKSEEAKAKLESAAKLAPEDARVVECQFLDALDKGDFDAAARLTEKAETKNLDNADGLTFRARLQAARNQISEAIASVDEALRRVPGSAEMYRLHGKLLVASGRIDDAIASLLLAVRARPTDRSSSLDYLSALMSVGRGKEALEHCRSHPQVCGTDPELASIWMDLEAGLGDRAMALQNRERIYRQKPGDRSNILALARLYIAAGRFDDSRKLIDALLAAPRTLDVTALEAQWYHTQNKQSDARQTYEKFIADQPKGPETLAAHEMLAKYQLGTNDIDGALKTLEAGRAIQDPKLAQMDRILSQVLLRLGRTDESIAASGRVIAAGGDESRELQRQLVEILLANKRIDEAEQEYAKLQSLEAKDPTVLVLKMQVKGARGDKAAARAVLDDAITRFPNVPLLQNVRGDMAFANNNPQEALDAYTKSLAIDKRQTPVLAARTRVYVALGRVDDAINDLRQIAQLAPFDQSARRTLIANLLDLGRIDSAIEEGEKLVRLNADSAAVAAEIGSILGSYKNWSGAERFFLKAYAKDKSAPFAISLVEAYLNQAPQKLTDAGTVLRDMRESVETNAGLLIVRARWLAAQGDKVGAREAMTKAVAKVDQSSFEDMRRWYLTLTSVATDQRERVAYLTQLEKAGVAPLYMRWYRANIRFGDGTTRTQAIEEFQPYMDPSAQADLRVATFRFLSGGLYSLGKPDDAVRFGKQGLEQFPDDTELLNNVAYILAKDLNRAEEAVPLAEHAVKLSSTSSSAFDTLGFVYYQLKKYPESRDALQQSFNLANQAGSVREMLVALVHLGNTNLAMGARDVAQGIAKFARDMAQQSPDAAKEIEAELADLLKKVE